MALIVVFLQILVCKAAFNVNFYPRLLFAGTTENAAGHGNDCGIPGSMGKSSLFWWLQSWGQKARRDMKDWGRKNVIRHFKERPVKGKATWRCQCRCNFSCLSHHSFSVPSIPVYPFMRPTALNSFVTALLQTFGLLIFWSTKMSTSRSENLSSFYS